MPAEIFIYSHQSLGCARGDLEDDIEELLDTVGEITGGGSGQRGWNIDIALAEGVPYEEWVSLLATFLREWGVPHDTNLEVFPPGWVVGQSAKWVEVFPE